MSYLKQVLGSLGKKGVLLPVLAQFLDNEASETVRDPKNKKRIVQKDALLTIRCMRHRYSEFAHGQKKRKEFAFHPSAIGQCQRKLWFEHFGAPADRKHKDDALQTHFIFELGTYLHVIFQNLCERAGILKSREFQLYSAGEKVEGTCDGLLVIDDVDYVLEIKSINSGQWTKVQQAPKFEHRLQAMCYMKVLGYTWAIIVYVNKDRGSAIEHVVEFNEEVFQKDIKSRIIKYERHLIKRTVPDREGTGPTTFPCSWCQFNSFCFTPERVMAFAKSLK